MRRIGTFLLLLTLCCELGAVVDDRSRQSQEGLGLHSQRLSTRDGLGSNSVRATLQDQAGYLWVATADGLSRYDGHHFINFVPAGGRTPTFSSSSVHALYVDSLRQLLWVESASHHISCYDLRQHSFTDFLEGKAEAPLPEVHISPRNTVFSGEHFGLRQIYYEGGRPHARDFTAEGGQLHANRMRPACEDSEGRLWLPTHCGLAILNPDGELRYVVHDGVWRAVAFEGRRVLALDDSNTIHLFDFDGRRTGQISIPTAIGHTEKVWSHFRWRGLWVLLGRDHTMLVDPKTGKISSPMGWDIHDGRLVGETGGYTWVCDTDGALMAFCPDGQVRSLQLIPKSVLDMGIAVRYSVAQAAPRQFFIATNGNGLFHYDAAADELTHYSAYGEHPLLHSDYLLSAYVDRSGALWLGNELVGLTCLTPHTIHLETLLPNAAGRHDRSNHVTACHPLTAATVAVATRDGSLYTYDCRTHELAPTAHVHNTAYALLTDHLGRLWAGTRGSGVSVDGRTFNPSTTPACPAQYVHSLAEDRRGRVWIGTAGEGLVCAHARGDDLQFQTFALPSAGSSDINALSTDGKGRLWVGTNKGLFVADASKAQPTDTDFHSVQWAGGNHHILSLAPDSVGRMWVGMKHEGTVRITWTDETHVDVAPLPIEATGLSHSASHRPSASKTMDVLAIQPIPGGQFLLATGDGIVCWDERTHSVTRHLRSADNMTDICVMGAITTTGTGDYLVGTNYGLVRIPPLQPVAVRGRRPQITDIVVEDSSLLLSGAMPDVGTTLILPHDQNSLAVHFSTLDMATENVVTYDYWLEGLDRPWSRTTADGVASYDGLSPGRYRLHVRPVGVDAANAGDVETVLALRIRHPWWNTWWAWGIYLLLAAAFAAVILVQLLSRARLLSRLRMERRLAQFRMDFFTQVSHELRTPLALIQGGVDSLHSQPKPLAQPVAEHLQVIVRGARRLNKLVNQLLLFRRISENAVRLHAAETDVVRLVRDVCTDFFLLAESRGVRISFTPFADALTLVCDKDMVETIAYNLVSNAVKYTPSGGNIQIRIPAPASDADSVSVKVFNEAPPFTEEQRSKLFKPYMHGYVSHGGMGIGLYVAHELALLSHGDLTYTEADGGVMFTLTLPVEEVEKGKVKSEKYDVPDTEDGNSYSSFDTHHSSFPDSPTPTQLLPRSVNSQRVAIVEDDTDMAEQLRQQVGVFFHVETYADGAEALKGILASPPDLVLCDVMLPSLDGYSIVRRLKGNEATSHLPVILLTSLQDDAHHVRGIKSGADAFLTKPCNPEVLVNLMAQLMKKRTSRPNPGRPTPNPSREGGERLRDENAVQTISLHNNTLSQAGGLPSLTGGVGGGSSDREVIQQLVQQFVETPTAEDTIVTSLADQRFREQATQLVAQNLASTDFNADALAQQMGIERTVFFRRFKQLLGHSPSEYIRTERMRLAARLITEDKLNVAEVAQRTGFTDASHFIRAFKAFYGVTPTQFRQV